VGSVGVDVGLWRAYLYGDVDEHGVSEALAEALTKARAELVDAEQRAEDLRQIVSALEFTLRLKRPSSVNGDGDFDWVKASRRAAVQQALAEAPNPLSPKDLTITLTGHGRKDNAPGISATLSRLKDDGKVTSAGYGKWTLPDRGSPHTSRARRHAPVATTSETEERLETA
jgi:hypothetical protein